MSLVWVFRPDPIIAVAAVATLAISLTTAHRALRAPAVSVVAMAV